MCNQRRIESWLHVGQSARIDHFVILARLVKVFKGHRCLIVGLCHVWLNDNNNNNNNVTTCRGVIGIKMIVHIAI